MRRALFVAPAVPSPTRSGLRMRGWLFLRGLARDHRITLVAGSPAFPDESHDDVAALGDLVDRAVLLRFRTRSDPGLWRRRLVAALGRGDDGARDCAIPTRAMMRLLSPLQQQPFDLIHVFRLYMLPVARAAQAGRARIPLQLDLDDWESRTRQSLADLVAREGLRQERRLRAEATVFEAMERTCLPSVEQCFVCSDDDAGALSAAYALRRVAVVENAVPQPLEPVPRSESGKDSLLFVGSLGYLPNEDAVGFLLDAVLPGLRAARGRGIELVVAGGGAGRALRRRLRATAGVRWIDAPARVEPLYERARIALVPVRAGGGTRVKVLEAFAQGRPVVATAAAVAGLGVTPGHHFLRAESPNEWVGAICALLDAPAAARRLADSASGWLREHSLERAVARVASLSANLASHAADGPEQAELA